MIFLEWPFYTGFTVSHLRSDSYKTPLPLKCINIIIDSIGPSYISLRRPMQRSVSRVPIMICLFGYFRASQQFFSHVRTLPASKLRKRWIQLQ